MAMRCLVRARPAAGSAFAVRTLVLTVFRAADFATALSAADFFCTAMRLAERDVGFCLAIAALPFRWMEKDYHKLPFAGRSRRSQTTGLLRINRGGHASLCPPCTICGRGLSAA